MRPDRYLAAFFVLTASLAASLRADVRLASPFGDGMVLQRDLPVAVWGWADAGERVVAEIAGRSRSVEADADGRWTLRLDPMPAGGPHELVVRGRNVVTVRDVLVGEVWLASGQSNMEFRLANARDAKEEIAQADYPLVRHFNVPRTVRPAPAETSAGEWKACTPDNAGGFSAVAYFFSRHLHQKLGVPVGILNASHGGSPIEAWMDAGSLTGDPDFASILQRAADYPEEYRRQKAAFDERMKRLAATDPAATQGPAARPPRPPVEPERFHRLLSVLYNGMIAPLRPFTVRGVIWYQGESNAERGWQYRKLLPVMIRSWRHDWDDPSLPFLIVQIANFHRADPDPDGTGWAELRESQALTARQVPNTALAVTIDIGERDDIHPKNKQDVGLRLGLLAERMVYGRDVAWSGPVFKSMQVRGREAHLEFEPMAAGLRVKGESLEGFTIAGAGRRFFPARAELRGDTVVVWNEQVPEPAAVRYGWAASPVCTLFNTAGLPAAPFRTDDWPGVTQGRN